MTGVSRSSCGSVQSLVQNAAGGTIMALGRDMRRHRHDRMGRRSFLRKGGAAAVGLGVLSGLSAWLARDDRPRNPPRAVRPPQLREAMFTSRLDHGAVQCAVCFRRCVIPPGQRGFCRNRENRGGTLVNLACGRPSAVHVDPVEKEPQHHFLPGSQILCFGTAGCNFRCLQCQNWHLSQNAIEDMAFCYDLPPDAAVHEAVRHGIPTISFTYNDPISFYEYMYDIACLAREHGVRIMWHSNGSLNPEPLEELLKVSDTATIDLKGFTDDFYRKVSSAELKPVLESLKTIRASGVWLEIVNLIIPTLNDDPADLRRMCAWIVAHLGPDVPLHFSRFHPAYRLTHLVPTPLETLEQAYAIARESGINYVSIGNVPGHELNSTFCSKCGRRLIHRIHFEVVGNDIVDGKCRFCGHTIPGVWA